MKATLKLFATLGARQAPVAELELAPGTTVGALIGLHTMTEICKRADCVGAAYVVGCIIYLRAQNRHFHERRRYVRFRIPIVIKR